MNKAQRITVWIACVAIFAVNFPEIFPHYYKGVQRPVGSEIVSVYVPNSDSSAVTVAITNPRNNFADTGQRVAVYLRNNYRPVEIPHAPRLTIALLLCFAIIYAIISRVSSKQPSSSTSQ